MRYGFSKLGLEKIEAKCYKENVASEKALLSAGMRRIGEDDTFYYFYKTGGYGKKERKISSALFLLRGNDRGHVDARREFLIQKIQALRVAAEKTHLADQIFGGFLPLRPVFHKPVEKLHGLVIFERERLDS